MCVLMCLQNVNQMSSLDWSTRIKGFVICFILGLFFSVMGALMLFLLPRKKFVLFGIFYSLGNITSLMR